MKRLSWPGVALVCVLGAAFLVQATSTWKLGERQHLADIALPALVVLLEVGSITSAAIFFAAKRRGLRVRSLLLLAITAGLGGFGGVVAYGFVIGIPVAILMLGLVEVVGTYRREQDRSTSTTVDQPSTEPVDAAPSPPVDAPVDEPHESASHLDGLRKFAAGIDWPPPHVELPVTLNVAGYRPPAETPTVVPFVDPHPTEPLERADDGRPLDLLEPPEDEPEAPDESWRDHEPTEAEYAAVILDHLPRDGRRLTEAGLHEALSVVVPGVTKYRAKKYLGNRTTRHRVAAEDEEKGATG